MSCTRARQLLDAWLDDELDPATREEIAAHFPQCPACEAAREERGRLRTAIRFAAPRDKMPPAVEAAVRTAVLRESRSPNRQRRGPTWWQAIGLAGATALLAAFATVALLQPPDFEPATQQVVASHVAAFALAEGRHERLVQVAASDQHQVRPWFQGKLDFAPPVPDLAAEGFTLLGGRLDHVGGRQAAVIVYRIRNHPVDLYVWRHDGRNGEAAHVESLRGFGVATWAAGGLRYAAISDVDPADLRRFASALQRTIQ
ncbi:hypothetical protein BWI17_10185 [Betaproteobacteria bacterium GR16-43]|nr:hypothetical protein BWI17_10185 [Betaproteobacteria bacterium GR16-43]